MLPLLRVLRVLRLPKLIPRARGLRLMLLTLLWSMPAFINFFAVFFLFMSIYVGAGPLTCLPPSPPAGPLTCLPPSPPIRTQSIIGMNLFGQIMFQQNYNRDANFQTYPSAMMMLFRCDLLSPAAFRLLLFHSLLCIWP